MKIVPNKSTVYSCLSPVCWKLQCPTVVWNYWAFVQIKLWFCEPSSNIYVSGLNTGHTQDLEVKKYWDGPTHSWFWSFHWICWQTENVRILPVSRNYLEWSLNSENKSLQTFFMAQYFTPQVERTDSLLSANYWKQRFSVNCWLQEEPWT